MYIVPFLMILGTAWIANGLALFAHEVGKADKPKEPPE
jgi:hypothetical protein